MSEQSKRAALNFKDQKILNKFIKAGGRNGAKVDFFKVLGKAAGGKK